MWPRHTEPQSLFSPSESRILTGWVLKRHPWRLSSNWIDLHLILLPSDCGCLPLIRPRCRVSQASISLTHTPSQIRTRARTGAHGELSRISQLIQASRPNQSSCVCTGSASTALVWGGSGSFCRSHVLLLLYHFLCDCSCIRLIHTNSKYNLIF